MRDDGEAEDVLQEAYTRAFAAIAGFRGEAGVATSLNRIVLNEAHARVRTSARVAERAPGLDARPPADRGQRGGGSRSGLSRHPAVPRPQRPGQSRGRR